MCDTLFLSAIDIRSSDKWRWRLCDSHGTLLGTHDVQLDRSAPEYHGYVDLYERTQEYASPDKRRADESRLIEEVGRWIGEHVFGPLACLMVDRARIRPTVVRVKVCCGSFTSLEAGRGIVFRPLELAFAGERALTLQDVSLVFDTFSEVSIALSTANRPVGSRLRILAVFSLPLGVGSLNLRHERYQLRRLIQSIAHSRGLAIDLRVLQYGVTRDALRKIIEEGEGWDVLHFSGHGLAARLVLEDVDGQPDIVSSAELIELLRPARARLKWVTLSSCLSAAATIDETLRWLGLDEVRVRLHKRTKAGRQDTTGDRFLSVLAETIVDELGCAVLAMRFPVDDQFAVDLCAQIYDGMLGRGQSLARSLQIALPKMVTADDVRYSPLSVATPALFGPRAVDFRLTAPKEPLYVDSKAPNLAAFPRPALHLVGRVQALTNAHRALALRSPYRGVLLHGMAGVGKTTCALELAWQYEDLDRFQAFVWFRAPDEGYDEGQALLNFAMAMERQIPGLKMAHLVGNPIELASFLPRLSYELGRVCVLVVLDNVESLLRQAATNSNAVEWRDPRWQAVVTALLAHDGESRVILTSRLVPDLSVKFEPPVSESSNTFAESRLLTIPIHALTLEESLLLARELPNLGRMLREGMSGNERNRQLVLSTLHVLQGHPTLIDFAEARAVDSDKLCDFVDKLVGVWNVSDETSVAFLKDGVSPLDPSEFLGAINSGVLIVSQILSKNARIFFHFLCCLDSSDRYDWIVEATWLRSLDRRAEEDGKHFAEIESPVPSLNILVNELANAGLLEVKQWPSAVPDDHGRNVLLEWQVHPAVAAAARRQAGNEFRDAVDEELTIYWYSCYRHGVDSKSDPGYSFVVTACRHAVPYLKRKGKWGMLLEMTQQLMHRDQRPQTFAFAASVLRDAANASERADDVLEATAKLGVALFGCGDLEEAERLLRYVIEESTQRRSAFHAQFESAALDHLVRIRMQRGDLEDALDLVDQKREATDRAGYGPWTRLADDFLAVSIRERLFPADETRDEAYELFLRAQRLQDSAQKVEEETPPECVTPWQILEGILEMTFGRAMRVGEWDLALQVNESLCGLVQERTGGLAQVLLARYLVNRSMPLIQLGRYREAREGLNRCRSVFEWENMPDGLGQVFSCFSELEHRLGHNRQAIEFARAALRYRYITGDPVFCARSHHALFSVLQAEDPSQFTQEAVAHLVAATLIDLLTKEETLPLRLAVLGRFVTGKRDAVPVIESFATLCNSLAETDGVQFIELFNRLQTSYTLTGDETLANVLALAAEHNGTGSATHDDVTDQ